MRDVTEALAATSGGITRSENRLLLDAIAKVHGAFRGTRVEGLTRHDDRLDLFNPDRLAAEHWCDHDPAQARWRLWGHTAAAAHGWRLFPTLVDTDVADAVLELVAHPGSIAERIGSPSIHVDSR